MKLILNDSAFIIIQLESNHTEFEKSILTIGKLKENLRQLNKFDQNDKFINWINIFSNGIFSFEKLLLEYH